MKRAIKLILATALISSLYAKDVKDLFEKCTTCHGDKAEEKAFGKSKILVDLSKEEIITALKAYKEGTKDETGMGRIMESQVYSLEEQDMINIAEYIMTFK